MRHVAKAVAVCLTAGLLFAQRGGPGLRGGNGSPNGPQSGQQNGQQRGGQNGQLNSGLNQPAPTRPEDFGSIEGQVFNAATGEPLKKASVTLRGLSGRGLPAAVTTDAGGRFSLTSVEPGRYRLFAERNGFVRQEYGARGPERSGTALSVDKAQRVTSIELRLTPQAVITGRISDEDGDPVKNVTVQAMRIGYNQGRRQLIAAGDAQTNDLGEYRLFDVPGGKYYVSAAYRNGPQVAVGKDRYLPAYYPGTNDPATAVLIDVPAGTQMRGIDMTLHRGPTISVKGKIVSAVTNAPARGASVRLLTRGNGLSMRLGQAMQPGRGQGGDFEIRGVTPGAYTLVVDMADQRRRSTYRQPLDVGPSGVDGLMVTVPAPADLTGQVRIDGQGEVDFGGLTMTLRLRDPLPVGALTGKVKPDGAFTIESLMPDSYELTVSGLPAGYYVKSARFGSEEILESGLNLSSAIAGKLDVTLSAAAAQIEGVVLDSKQQPAKGALVTLVPDARRQWRTSLFKTAKTEDNGHYSILGITPGEYTLYAFEDIESGAYLDPDFLKPLERSAESISLRESAHETRQLKQIAAVE